MKQTISSNDPKNNFLYFIISIILYFSLFILISLNFKGIYGPFIGGLILGISIYTDYFLSSKNIRIIIRFIIVIAFYFLLKFLVSIFSILASPPDGYHNFVDKLPFLFTRDTAISLLIILFYFIFDAIRVIRVNVWGYITSTIMLITVFFLFLKFNAPIQKTMFHNYFNLSVFLIFIVGLFLFRHTIFNQNLIGKKFNKNDLYLLVPFLISLILLLFVFILPEHIERKDKNNESVLEHNLFQFDFSNYIELKDQIKQSDDRVLILELQGVRDSVQKRINAGWNKQIYLKRFSLEEYTGSGRFKVSDNYTDPYSPPTYMTGYSWAMKDIPDYKKRINITETLYLINIDPSSLMGSDLLTKASPMVNWPGSPFKQVYKSYCLIPDFTYNDLIFKDLTQKKFLSDIHPERKKVLMNWGDEKKDKKIREMALDITRDVDSPVIKAYLIQDYLRNNYYYSLKPGLSKNGNQLEYFLTESKKGYCSYFAFSMALMLRSIGIASRVAVGFAPDMENRTLNFYDIRSLHGHAWVEIYFDDYGWVTFDPTSSRIAAGEKYERFVPEKEERNKLISEILKNKDKMKEVTKEREDVNIFDYISLKFRHSARWLWIIILFLTVSVLVILTYIKKNIFGILYKISWNPRRKTIYLYRDITGKLFDLGFPVLPLESIIEYSQRLARENIIDIMNITDYYQQALFREKREFGLSTQELDEIRGGINDVFSRFDRGKKIRAFFNVSRLWRKILPLIILLFLFSGTNHASSQQSYNDMIDYILEANNAMNEGYYDKALELLNAAEKKFPNEYRPDYEKGKLYYYYELYDNALIEFLKAKSKGALFEENYQFIASTYGKTGDYQNAVKTYEEAFEKLYYSIDLYDKLSWMYYKVNRIDTGIKKAIEGLKLYRNSSDLLMTLGTLYSAVYDYKKSKQSYLDSIKYSYDDYNSSYFRSIAFYNLSILERTFLYYENAFNAAVQSIQLDNRGSPHLQLSYLYLDALELKDAHREVLTASSLKPTTLFPQLSLVYIYMASGRIDEAIKQSRELLAETDFSWMLYFGASKDDFYSELYKNLAAAYQYKYRQINSNDRLGFIPTITRPFRKIYYRVLGIFYNFKYSNLSIKIGEEKIKGGGELDGLITLSNAYEKIWPNKALKLLRLAEKVELPSNPQKQKIYNIQESILENKSSPFYNNDKKKKVLEQNIVLLDTKWEKGIIADTLVELINSSTGKERPEYTDRLFSIHPAYLPINNIKMKMEIAFNDDNFYKKTGKKLIGYLRKRGIINRKNSRFRLEINNLSDLSFNILLYDNGKTVKSNSIVLESKKRLYEYLSLEIFKALFIEEI